MNGGNHILAELSNCKNHSLLKSGPALLSILHGAASAAGCTVVQELYHLFGGGGGVTATCILAESLIAAHTWPEDGRLSLDIYCCGQTAKPEIALLVLIHALQPTSYVFRQFSRDNGLIEEIKDGE